MFKNCLLDSELGLLEKNTNASIQRQICDLNSRYKTTVKGILGDILKLRYI